jgi:hypothetical protein
VAKRDSEGWTRHQAKQKEYSYVRCILVGNLASDSISLERIHLEDIQAQRLLHWITMSEPDISELMRPSTLGKKRAFSPKWITPNTMQTINGPPPLCCDFSSDKNVSYPLEARQLSGKWNTQQRKKLGKRWTKITTIQSPSKRWRKSPRLCDNLTSESCVISQRKLFDHRLLFSCAMFCDQTGVIWLLGFKEMYHNLGHVCLGHLKTSVRQFQLNCARWFCKTSHNCSRIKLSKLLLSLHETNSTQRD